MYPRETLRILEKLELSKADQDKIYFKNSTGGHWTEARQIVAGAKWRTSEKAPAFRSPFAFPHLHS